MHRSLGIGTFLLKKKGLKLVVLNWLHQFISSPLNNILHKHRISICKKHFTPSLTLTIIKTNMSSGPQAVPFSYLHFTVWSGSVLRLRCSCRTFSPSTRWEALKPRSTRKISLATYHSACIFESTQLSALHCWGCMYSSMFSRPLKFWYLILDIHSFQKRKSHFQHDWN